MSLLSYFRRYILYDILCCETNGDKIYGRNSSLTSKRHLEVMEKNSRGNAPKAFVRWDDKRVAVLLIHIDLFSASPLIVVLSHRTAHCSAPDPIRDGRNS